MSHHDIVKTPGFWKTLLWRYCSAQIGPDKKFFLSVDSKLLSELASDALGYPLDSEAAVDAFFAASRSLFVLSNGRAEVSEEAWKTEDKTSYAIVLAAHQVLIVEMMGRDSEISEHAYFPRYRKSLGLDEAQDHNSPIATQIFQRIWKTLSDEIISHNGANLKCITFAPGMGRDKNRQLPLSQALLTRHEMNLIKDRIGKNRDVSRDNPLLQILFRSRSLLGRRSQSLVFHGDSFMRQRLCEQFRSFYLRPTDYTVWFDGKQKSTETERLSLKAYIDCDDLFDDQITFYALEEGKETAETSFVSKAFDSLMINGFLLFVKERDSFSLANPNNVLPAIDVLFAFAKGSGFEKDRLPALIRDKKILSYPNNLPKHLSCLIVENFELASLSEFKAPETANILAAIGGLRADDRLNLFLSDYLPNGFTFNETKINENENLFVNDEEMSVIDLLKELREGAKQQNYRLAYRDSVFEMSVCSINALPKTKFSFGFVLEKGVLNPNQTHIGADNGALTGAVFQKASEHGSLPSQTLLAALIDKNGKRIQLDEKSCSAVAAWMSGFSFGEIFLTSAQKVIEERKSIRLTPETLDLIQKLCPKLEC